MAHILVIDDNSDIRYILSEILTDNGHTVSSADDGKIGMALTDTNQYLNRSNRALAVKTILADVRYE